METEVKDGFWKRQFSNEVTPAQIWFDIFFGIAIPILCLVFDPAIFRGGILGDGKGFLNSIQYFAYTSIGLGILTLTVWLSAKVKSTILISLFSGIFFAGAFLAFALGVVLFPLSSLGLLLLIGVFGYTPFLTSFVFLRNGVRALRKTKISMSWFLLVGTMLLGMIFVIGVPFAVNWKVSGWISYSVNTIIHSEKEQEINLLVQELKTNSSCSDSCYEDIVWAYNIEESETKRRILSKAYFELTGKNIKDQLRILKTNDFN